MQSAWAGSTPCRFDERSKVKRSMRLVDQATGEDISKKAGPKHGLVRGAWP